MIYAGSEGRITSLTSAPILIIDLGRLSAKTSFSHIDARSCIPRPSKCSSQAKRQGERAAG